MSTPMKDTSLKKSYLVSKGNRKAQELKIPLRVYEIPPETN
jgi:hypothetical protein